MLKRIFIAPPFGNYLAFKTATSVWGSYILFCRKRVLWRFLKTVRPYKGGYVNSIGLRNPGIGYFKKAHKNLNQRVVSLAAIEEVDWYILTEHILSYHRHGIFNPLALELNVSCPNVTNRPFVPLEVIQNLSSIFPLILKLPPHHRKNSLYGRKEITGRYKALSSLQYPSV